MLDKEQTLFYLRANDHAVLERHKGTDFFRLIIPDTWILEVEPEAGKALIRMREMVVASDSMFKTGPKTWRLQRRY